MALGAHFFATLTLAVLHAVSASQEYEAFRQKHGRAALKGADPLSYEERRDLFHRRKQEALAHNARKLSWRMTVNRFSDFSDSELKAMLGYKRVGGRWGGDHSAPAGASSLLEEHEDDSHEIDTSKLASEVDWRNTMSQTANWIRNQGACGSCWAVAAVGALEMHAEKAHGVARRLSHHQLVDCTPNPRHCGGEGGCKGATAELAFQYIRKYGIVAEDAYDSASGRCNRRAPSSLRVSQFRRLPVNRGSYLLQAVATKGPVVVSVDGGSWYGYDGGVFSGCDQDTVVNHAVLAVGYGYDPDDAKNYWLIRNSWGADWGDSGFIKIERHSRDSDYCGLDVKPKEGVFCDDAPANVTVCGMCGITSDSVYPGLAHSRSSRRPSSFIEQNRRLRIKGTGHFLGHDRYDY